MEGSTLCTRATGIVRGVDVNRGSRTRFTFDPAANAGAVPGSRHTFTSLDDFRSAYGSDVDRIGNPRGEYLGIPPGSSWGQRGLQPGSMSSKLNGYQFTGDLPRGWHIEVSTIAEAFGQPGGGIQAVVLDDANKLVKVEVLIGQGVLK